MKLAVLFSGGKDSTMSAWLAKKEGYELSCLISINSRNLNSFMFHTPSINCVVTQSKAMGVPLILRDSEGIKEKELEDLRDAISEAIENYEIEGVVTGAVESVYQASCIQKICNELGIECFNPLWQKDQIELLQDLIKEGFDVVISGVFAYPLGEKFLGRKIDGDFIEEMKELNKKYKINPAGEGGEFESFVLNCSLFESRLKIRDFEDIDEGENSWRRNYDISN
jgi:diphthine-ammonia ligase